MSGKTEEMKENSTLNWRSTGTKVSIKSYKCDGLEYEPENLKTMLTAFDRHLNKRDYKYSVVRDREFYQSKLVLEGKVKHLRQQGKEKRPNASSALTSEEEEVLWTTKTLGDSSPGLLSQTMWWKATEGSKCLEVVYYSGGRPRKSKVAGRLR